MGSGAEREEPPDPQPAPSPSAGTRGQALRLGALRLLLFKLLLFDVLLTCSRLRAPPAARGDPAAETRPLDPRLPAPATRPQPQRVGEPSAPTGCSRRSERPRAQTVCPAGIAAPGRPRGSHPPSGSRSQREPSLGGGDGLYPPSLGPGLRTRPQYPGLRPWRMCL